LKTHRSVVVNLHADHKPDFVTQARRQGIQTTIASPPKFQPVQLACGAETE